MSCFGFLLSLKQQEATRKQKSKRFWGGADNLVCL